MAYLQVVKGDYFSELSHRNRIRILTLTAPRGNIYDRYGQLLAATRPAFAVSIMEMGSKEDLNKSIAGLARLLDMSEDSIRDRIRKHQRPFEPVRIATDISPVVHTLIVENRDNLPGVIIETLPIRDYVYDSFAAHLFGYVSEISAKELADPNWDGRRQGDIIGKTGLERRYDRELRGVDGGQQVEVDVAGHLVEVLGEIPPVNGANLVLTIDAELQRVAEDFFDQWTQRVRTGQGLAQAYPDANRGAVVVMKVDTGEILAMFSKPDFDPNLFAAGIDVQTYRDLANDPHKPFLDRVLQARYPPGSTFKMVTAAAALELERTTPSYSIFDSGNYRYGGVSFRCWRTAGHGWVDLRAALKYSCNTYFYEMGRRLIDDPRRPNDPPQGLIEWAERFGLGLPTGIDLALPGESSEIRTIIAGRDDARDWQGGMTLQAAIGQGHVFTPIQMAVYTAAIANGGTRYVPKLVREVLSPDGRVIRQTEPEVAGTVGLSPETLEQLREGMLASSLELGGPAGPGTSAWLFHNFPIKVAGKTGTAQAPQDPGEASGAGHAWYIAFAPYDKPEIAVVVLVERGGSGSTAAAPIAKAIFEQYFGLNDGARPRPPSELPSGGD